jgi:hypothetical protein
MKIPTINTPTTSSVVTETAVITDTPSIKMTNMTPIEQKNLTPAETMPVMRPRAFYVASYWHIEPAPGVDMITASNNNTGDKYNGSIAEFNMMLKGN